MNISVESENLINLESSWLQHLEQEFSEDYMQNLLSFLVEEKSLYKIYPPLSEIFNAFSLTPFDKTKVVIIGQDPYHAADQAHGLCFSVCDGVKFPPSLLNIFKELERSIEGFKIPRSGNLSLWAKQGVFLLNTCLTVRENQPNSHAAKGWEIFTDKVIENLNARKNHLVFMLWGSYAKNKGKFIYKDKHLIL